MFFGCDSGCEVKFGVLVVFLFIEMMRLHLFYFFNMKDG